MAEKPILMSGPMVRAIYAKLKTVTREIMNPQPPEGRNSLDQNQLGDWCWGPSPDDLLGRNEWRTPRYAAGDVAWVKESWRTVVEYDDLKPSELEHAEGDRLTVPILYEATPDDRSRVTDVADGGWGKLRPSIFMCRWMSRIDLPILGARPEILGDITEEEALAEGCQQFWDEESPEYQASARGETVPVIPFYSAIESYRRRWDAIHGAGAWERDCRRWVWRYEFEGPT